MLACWAVSGNFFLNEHKKEPGNGVSSAYPGSFCAIINLLPGRIAKAILRKIGAGANLL